MVYVMQVNTARSEVMSECFHSNSVSGGNSPRQVRMVHDIVAALNNLQYLMPHQYLECALHPWSGTV